MMKKPFHATVEEDLNRSHKVTLTEGQISTILYCLENYLETNGGNSIVEFDNIFEELEQVVDNFYKTNDPLDITPFQEELEIKKYIRDNPI